MKKMTFLGLVLGGVLLFGGNGLAEAREENSAGGWLTDEQKMKAELFDNKLSGLRFSALFASQAFKLSLDEFVHYDFLTNLVAFDTAIAVWNEKFRHDAVRPFSAIRYVYREAPLTAWGGPGRGTVSDIPASAWRSCLNTADHPEYPSGSAAFCSVHAQASRNFLVRTSWDGRSPPPRALRPSSGASPRAATSNWVRGIRGPNSSGIAA